MVHQTLIRSPLIGCSYQNTGHNDIYDRVHVHLCTSPGDIWLIYVEHVVLHICHITEKKIGFDERQVHCTLGLVNIHKHSPQSLLFRFPYHSIVRCTVHDLVSILWCIDINNFVFLKKFTVKDYGSDKHRGLFFLFQTMGSIS